MSSGRRERSPRSGQRSPSGGSSLHTRRSHEYRSDPGPTRRPYERNELSDERKQQSTPSPPGFPVGYKWGKGDWLCPRQGCEGFVTRAKHDRCIKCGRSQPFFRVLTELARNEKYRTEKCINSSCEGRECSHAHASIEIRDYVKSREWNRVSESQSPPATAIPWTEEETRAFINRWSLQEPALSVLSRLPENLSEVILSTFYADSGETNISGKFLKCLADLIRPRRREGKRPDQVLGYLSDILRRNYSATGIACSQSGVLVVTLDKDVLVINLRDFPDENVLGLLAFALTFNGLTVVHSQTDLDNLKESFPKLYVDLCESRVRIVDNPSQLLFIAPDELDACIDRAVQARLDSLNPNPLLPTP
jgi:hypothetical protein